MPRSQNEGTRKRSAAEPHRSTSPLPKKGKISLNNNNNEHVEKQAGTIQHMTLQNFMCHSLLEVDFSENNVCLIIGQNGSGKSAILTALIVGLGGRALKTNRAKNAKDLIKNGKQSCSISIQISNKGFLRYKPNVFGNSIIITKKFTRSGQTNYTVKNDSGQIVTTHAKEVSRIIQCLNIQIDNPVCLLTQDIARNFLSNTDPKAKFTLFTRATRLESFKFEYETIIENQNECTSNIEVMKKKLAELQNEIEKLRLQLDSHKRIVSMKQQKTILEKELRWSKVQELEIESQNQRSKIDEITKKINELEMEKSSKEGDMNENNEKIKEYERKIEKIRKYIEKENRPVENLKEQIGKFENEYNKFRVEKARLNIRLQDNISKVDSLEKEIANSNVNLHEIQKAEERATTIKNLREEVKSVDECLQNCNNEIFQKKNNLVLKQENANTLQKEIQTEETESDRNKNKLRALKENPENNLMIYGTHIPNILKSIQHSKNNYQKLPKGPLGSYIKVKDSKFTGIIEQFIDAGTLGAFLVDNHNDAELVRKAFSNCISSQYQPQLITTKFYPNKHDVENHLVQVPRIEGCYSLYELLIIDDPVVFNCIVDTKGIENILIIPNDDIAMKLMSDPNNVPKNCKMGITYDGNIYYPCPDYRTYAGKPRRPRYLQTDTKEEIKFLQESIAMSENRQNSISNELKRLRKDIYNQEILDRELQERIRHLVAHRGKTLKEIEVLEKESADAEIHYTNTSEQENQYKIIKDVLVEETERMKQIEEKMKLSKDERNKFDSNLKEIQNKIIILEEKLVSVQADLNEQKSIQRQLQTNVKFKEDRHEAFGKELENTNQNLIKLQQEIQTESAKAFVLGERPNVVRTEEDIMKQIQEIRKELAPFKNKTDNMKNVADRYHALVPRHTHMNETILSLSRQIKELGRSVECRKKHYMHSEKYFTTLMMVSFNKIMNFMNITGTLEIDMKMKKLDLIVKPQNECEVASSNLSGGERSVSTIVFLFSLWQCMNFPFTFLDEFDVFMDKLNRSKVIQLLLRHAKSKPNVQFVFLTPQDVSFIEDNVSIMRLKDPERVN